MMIVHYPSKKDLKACVGQPLRYTETSMFGPEFKAYGEFYGSNRPSITGIKAREFFATITMANGLIAKVS
jgi:hypothetical protein